METNRPPAARDQWPRSIEGPAVAVFEQCGKLPTTEGTCNDSREFYLGRRVTEIGYVLSPRPPPLLMYYS